MHRIDTPTAQKDKFGAGKNGFTRGNPQTGTPATDLDNDYFDMLQEELAGVVEASGVNLEKSKHNQLLTALKALLLSRAHPFADIKADGAAAIAEALSNLDLVGGLSTATVGRLIGIRAITSSSTYTPKSGAKFALVRMVGGGGAGGSPSQNGNGFTSGAGGGNSGCYAEFLIDLSSVSTVNCVIGAGGLPTAQGIGASGGDTSFGSFVTVKGGGGGLLLPSSQTENRIYGMSGLPSVFGTSTGVTMISNDCGRTGSDAIILSSGARAGGGGASRLGGGTFAPGNDTHGISSTSYGGGGTGAVATSASFGTNVMGGAGGSGVIIIEEYA
ncbi:TPA: carbohydrate kinase [Klebsiella variicola]|nr:carbohydrate kinase [Klebsiella variicola]